MPRLTDEELEALRLAAVAAVPLIAKWKAERAALDARVAKFEALVSEYEEITGNRLLPMGGVEEGKPKRGQVVQHIEAVLSSGGDFKEPEIRREIWKRFAIKYSRATVYTALRRGEAKRFEQKEKRWRMKIG